MQGKGEGWVLYFCPTFPSPGNGADQEMIPPVSHCACYLVTASTPLLLLSQDRLRSSKGKKSHPKSSHTHPGVPHGYCPAVSQCVCEADLQQNGFTTKMVCLQAILLPTTQPSIEPKTNGKKLLEMQGHPCQCWGSHPCWGSEHWGCWFSWLWVELPADPGTHLQMNHGFPWKKACPGEMRQPAA